tara:strand:+ start:30 stop:440 length:411 start_codon:yes stop_codon:yes gene_type:complete
MPLVGGGGSPNVAGGNPAGTSTSLNYVGKHAYAYSGSVTVSGSLTTMLEFVTAEQYVVAHYQLHGTLAQIGQQQLRLNITINGESITDTYWDSPQDNLNPFENLILLPPYSRIKFEASQASGSDKAMQITLMGEVY